MSDLEAIRELAEREERERHEAEQARKRAEREERLWRAELNRPEPEPQWHQFRSVHEMSAREYSAWCDARKPPLMPKVRVHTPPPAPPPPAAPALDWRKLTSGIARGLAEEFDAARKIDLERLGKLEVENADLQRRLRVLEGALIQRGLAASEGPIDLPPLRLNSHGTGH